MFFASKVAYSYAVKFVNAVPITCNHPWIPSSNTFTLSQFPLLCYIFDDLFVWMGKISGAGDDNN